MDQRVCYQPGIRGLVCSARTRLVGSWWGQCLGESIALLSCFREFLIGGRSRGLDYLVADQGQLAGLKDSWFAQLEDLISLCFAELESSQLSQCPGNIFVPW